MIKINGVFPFVSGLNQNSIDLAINYPEKKLMGTKRVGENHSIHKNAASPRELGGDTASTVQMTNRE